MKKPYRFFLSKLSTLLQHPVFTTPNKLVGYAIFLECFLPSYPHETQKKPFFVFCFQQSEILLQNYRVKGLYVNYYENAELIHV